MYGNTVVAGALSQTGPGLASVWFKDTGGNWKQQFAQTAVTNLGIVEGINLHPLNPQLEDWFGQSVAIHKNT